MGMRSLRFLSFQSRGFHVQVTQSIASNEQRQLRIPLFHPQRGHWTDAGGAARGEPGGDEGGKGKGEGSDRERNRVEGADFVEHAAEDFSGAGGEEKADDDSAEKHN